MSLRHPATSSRTNVIYDQGGGGWDWTFQRDDAEIAVTLKGRLRVSAAEGVRAAVLAMLASLSLSIKLILTRHEQAAAFMAAAHGRLTGKPSRGAHAVRLPIGYRGRRHEQLLPTPIVTERVVLDSRVTCPHCGTGKVERMPVDACRIMYKCSGCGRARPRVRFLARKSSTWSPCRRAPAP